MALPGTPFPNWASNANYTTGPDALTPTKAVPAGTADGFVRNTASVAQYVNYLFNSVWEHMEYLRNLTSEALTWTAAHVFSSSVTANGALTANGLTTVNGHLDINGTTNVNDDLTCGAAAAFFTAGSCTLNAGVVINGAALTSTTIVNTFSGSLNTASANGVLLNHATSEINYSAGAAPTARNRNDKALPATNSDWKLANAVGAEYGRVVAEVANAECATMLRVPRGCILTGVLVQVWREGVGANIDVVLSRVTPNITSGPSAPPAVATLETGDNAGATGYYGVFLPVAPTQTSTEDSFFTVMVTSPADTTAINRAAVDSITFSYSDVGPRNG